jgi:hypothetical protein
VVKEKAAKISRIGRRDPGIKGGLQRLVFMPVIPMGMYSDIPLFIHRRFPVEAFPTTVAAEYFLEEIEGADLAPCLDWIAIYVNPNMISSESLSLLMVDKRVQRLFERSDHLFDSPDEFH